MKNIFAILILSLAFSASAQTPGFKASGGAALPYVSTVASNQTLIVDRGGAASPANLRAGQAVQAMVDSAYPSTIQLRSNSWAFGNQTRTNATVHLRDGAMYLPTAVSWDDAPAVNTYTENKQSGQIVWRGRGKGYNLNEPPTDAANEDGWAKIGAWWYWGGSTTYPSGNPWLKVTCGNVRLEEGYDGFGGGKGGQIHLGNEDHFGYITINYTPQLNSGQRATNTLGRSHPLIFSARGDKDGVTTYYATPGIQSRSVSNAPTQTSPSGFANSAGELWFYSLTPQPATINQSNTWDGSPGFAIAALRTNSFEFFKPVITVGTNLSTSPYAANYSSFGALIFGTNSAQAGDAGKGSLAVPNDFEIYDKVGNSIRFWPSHTGENVSGIPSDPVMLIKGGRDIVLLPGANGNAQLGNSGNTNNQTFYLQYAEQTGPNSHQLQFRAKNSAGDIGYAGIMGYHPDGDPNGEGRLRFYSKAPTWNTSGTKGFSNPGSLVMEVSTNAITAMPGARFVGDGSGLTGVGLGGLTTNVYLTGADGAVIVQNFTNGALMSVSGLEAETTSYSNALQTAGATLTKAQTFAVNRFVVSRKFTGTWSDADRIAPMMGGTDAAHAIYLKGSGTISWANTPTHNANGVTFASASSEYGDTGWKPTDGGNSFVLNSARVVMVIPASSTTPIANNTHFMGNANTAGSSRLGFMRQNGSNIGVNGINCGDSGASMTGVTTSDMGVMLAARETSTSETCYFWPSSSAVGASPASNLGNTTTSTSLNSVNFALGCRNFEGSGFITHASYTLCGWEVGAGVNATKAQQIRDAWTALQNELAR